MAFRADSVPAPTDLLCENCGYGLNGLPADGHCPECGAPVLDSLAENSRTLPDWERPELSPLTRLTRTTAGVIFHPRRFFRRMLTRESTRRSAHFAFVQHWLAAYFFAMSAALHGLFIYGGPWDTTTACFIALAGGTALTPFMFAAILFVRWLAGRLTTFEARLHGMRLPSSAVTRALHYHAANLLPVSLLTALITAAYRLLLARRLIPLYSSEIPYLYVLSAWVILAATYLFITYWTAMKAIMYANR